MKSDNIYLGRPNNVYLDNQNKVKRAQARTSPQVLASFEPWNVASKDTGQITHIKSKVLPNLILDNMSSFKKGADLGASIYLSMNVGSGVGPYAQRSYDSLSNILSGGASAVHAAFDIENLGTPGTDFFAITEIGFSRWSLDTSVRDPLFIEAASGKGAWERNFYLAGRLSEHEQRKLEEIYNKAKSNKFKNLSERDRRSLWWLARYHDENIFEKSVIGGMEVWTINPSKMDLSKIPLRESNLHKHTHLLEAAITNLKTYGNAPATQIKALNHLFTTLSQTNGALIGYNILHYDIPALLQWIEDNRYSLDRDALVAADNLESLLKGHIKTNKVVDFQNILETTLINPIHKISLMRDVNKLRLREWVNRGEGFLKMDSLSRLFGYKQQHTALEDTITQMKVMNKLLPTVYREVRAGERPKAISTLRGLTGSTYSVDRRYIKQGTFMASYAGVGSGAMSAYDAVYRPIRDASGVITGFEEASLPGSIYTNINYQIGNVIRHNTIPEHKYGSLTLYLHNLDEDLIHTVTVPETITGTGEDFLRKIIHKTMIPGKTDRLGDDLFSNRILDRSLRGYNKIFESYDYAKKMMGVISDPRFKAGLSTPDFFDSQEYIDLTANLTRAERRNLKHMAYRLDQERNLIEPLLNNIEGLEDYQKNHALRTLKHIMEGRIVVPGVINQDLLVSPTKTIHTGRYNRAIPLNKGILYMGTYVQTRSSLQSMLSSRSINALVEELKNTGYITNKEASRFKSQVKRYRPEQRIVEDLAGIIYNRGVHASALIDFKTRGGTITRVGENVQKFIDAFEKGIQVPTVTKAFNMVGLSKPYHNYPIKMTKAQKREFRKSSEYRYESDLQKIIRFATTSATEYTSSTFSREQRAFIDNNTIIASMADKHDAIVREHVKSLGPHTVAAPKSARYALNELANSYLFSDIGVKFIGDSERDTTMVVYHKTHAKALQNMAPRDILRDPRVITFDIPFVNEDRILTVGGLQRINQLTLFANPNLKEGKYYFEDAFNQIIEAYRRKAPSIQKALRKAHAPEITSAEVEEFMAQGRSLAKRARYDILAMLSGGDEVESSEVLNTWKIGRGSRLANYQRSMVIRFDSSLLDTIVPEIDRSGFGAPALVKRALSDRLQRETGLQISWGGSKEGQTAKGYRASVWDPRELIPMAAYSSATTQRMIQGLNVRQLEKNLLLGSGFENPLIMTEEMLNRLKLDEGKISPWATIKTALMDDFKIAELAEMAGLKLPETPSTYEARAIISRDVAEKLTTRIQSNYVVDSLYKPLNVGDVIEGASKKKPITIGKLHKDAIIDAELSPITEGNITGIAEYTFTEPGKVVAIEETLSGSKRITIEREAPLREGDKLITEHGGKYTVQIMDAGDMSKLTGDSDIKFIMMSEAFKHKAPGEVMSGQLALVINEVNRYAEQIRNKQTVGSVTVEQLQEIVTDVLNKFFDTNKFKYKSVGVFTGITVPTRFNKTGFSLEDFHRNVVDEIDRRLVGKGLEPLYLMEKLRPSVGGIQFSTSYESFGVATSNEPWHKISGFTKFDKGVVKYGPREIEMLRIKPGLGKTADWMQGYIKEEALRISPWIGSKYADGYFYNDKIRVGDATVKVKTMGEVGKMWRIAQSYTGAAPDVDDIIIRGEGFSRFAENEIALSNFRRFRQIDSSEPLTREVYRGTYYDIKNMAVPDSLYEAEAGMINQSKLATAARKGGFWLQLPETFQINGRDMDKVFIPFSSPRATATSIVRADPVTASAASVFKAVQSYTDSDNKDKYANLYKALSDYDATVARAISHKKGFINQHVLAARLRGSGQFHLQTLSPRDLDKFPEGSAYISTEAFNEMFAGLGEKREQQLLEMAKTRGIKVMANRFPTMDQKSVELVNLMVSDELAREKNIIRLTVGTVMGMAGDNDGDFANLVASHWKDISLKNLMKINAGEAPDLENVGVKERKALEVIMEHNKYWEDNLVDREWRGRIISKAFEADSAAGQAFSYGEYAEKAREVIASRVTVGKVATEELAKFTIEEMEARLGREAIGYFSNFNTKIRRAAIALALEKGGVLSGPEISAATNLMSIVEQGAISSKHFSYEAIEKYMRATGKDLQSAISDRISVVENIREALMNPETSGSKEKFIEAVESLGSFMDTKSKTIEELRKGSNIKTLVRQDYTFDVMWDSLRKISVASGGMDKILKHPSLKLGMSGVNNLGELVDVLSGKLTYGSYHDIFNLIQEMVGMYANDEQQLLSLEKARVRLLGEQLPWGQGGKTPKFGVAVGEDMVTVGEMTAQRISNSLQNILGGGASKLTSLGWGAMAFAGLTLASNLVTDPLPRDMMPMADEAPPVDGGYIATPSGQPGGPVARVVPSGTGYENMQIMIRAKDTRGLSDAEIGDMVQQQISAAMPVNFNMNVTGTDNSERIDQLWVQSVVNNSIKHGYAF
jgi:hypothetical protein